MTGNFQTRRFRLRGSRGKCRGGFTLVEVLVALVVLSIVLVLSAQMVGVVSASWRSGVVKADTAAQCRVALGLIERDIRSLIVREDLPAFVDEDGNVSCAFYVAQPGAGGIRNLSLVRYKVEDPTTQPFLARADHSYSFAGALPGSGPQYGETNRIAALSDAISEQLAESVLALRVQFLDGEGKVWDHYHGPYSVADPAIQSRAAVVSMLVLDSAAYEMAMNSGSLPGLLGRLLAEPDAGETHARVWSRRVETELPTNLPTPVKAGVKVFERYVPLPVSANF